MGLLDEAIREHLELKRRRGADPGEIARQERDALGPARRQAEPAAAPADELAPGDDEPVAEDWDEASAADLEETGHDTEDEVGWSDAEDLPHEPSTESLEPARTQPAGLTADTGEATSEYDVLAGEPDDDEPAQEPEFRTPAPDDTSEDEEDVLEETPEFLQETPEHDRLWFEQRPPRDFDFDG